MSAAATALTRAAVVHCLVLSFCLWPGGRLLVVQICAAFATALIMLAAVVQACFLCWVVKRLAGLCLTQQAAQEAVLRDLLSANKCGALSFSMGL
jgi:hypothetical protein